MRNLSIIDLLDDHVSNTLRTEEMLTAGHKEEFGAKLVPRAYGTIVLLFIKLSPIGHLCKHGELLKFLWTLKFKSDSLMTIFLDAIFITLLLNKCVHKLILQEYGYFV